MNQLEYELDRLETNLEQVISNLKKLETRTIEQDALKVVCEDLNEGIESLWTKLERLECRAVVQFNEHTESDFRILAYGNQDCIWLKRVEREVSEGCRKVIGADLSVSSDVVSE